MEIVLKEHREKKTPCKGVGGTGVFMNFTPQR